MQYISIEEEEARINETNRVIKEKNMRWKAGKTSVSRLTREEMKKRCGTIINLRDFETGNIKISKKDKLAPAAAARLPEKFDWRDIDGKDYTTPVKDQGACGSCWIFGTVAALESVIKVVKQIPETDIDLSEQFILSCTDRFGCDGGTLYQALKVIRDLGIPDEACFPYKADDTIPCSDACSDWEDRIVKLTIPYRDLSAAVFKYWMNYPTRTFAKQIIQSAPVVTTMAIFRDFFSYTGGIYDRTSDDYIGGHAIAVYGWNDVEQYWICKNSWGRGWGEDGWFRIAYSYTSYPDFSPIDLNGFYPIAYWEGKQQFSAVKNLPLKTVGLRAQDTQRKS